MIHTSNIKYRSLSLFTGAMYVVISDLFVEMLNGISCSHRAKAEGLLTWKLFLKIIPR